VTSAVSARSFDGRGNSGTVSRNRYFPEIEYDKMTLGMNIDATTANDAEAKHCSPRSNSV
jgi:ribosomal protein L5